MEYRDDDKGYVIRCVDSFDGSVSYRGAGSGHKYVRKKDALMPKDTYTISGAKRALANLQRLYPEGKFYSIERLSCYYFDWGENSKEGDYRERIYDWISHSEKRLDELEEKNNFDRGDKMRINEIRYDLRMIKTILLEQGE